MASPREPGPGAAQPTESAKDSGHYQANASPVGASWMWTLAFWHHQDRSPTHGYEATREAAMRAFAKSWRRE
jgi:hypothetical protein